MKTRVQKDCSTFIFERCCVKVFEKGQMCRTEFDDGALLIALPEANEAYDARAVALGYEGETRRWQMCREHDFIHCLLAQFCGLPYSAALWAAAHNRTTELPGETPYWKEEATVLALQRFLNDPLLEDPWLDDLARFGDVDKLRWNALFWLRPAPEVTKTR